MTSLSNPEGPAGIGADAATDCRAPLHPVMDSELRALQQSLTTDGTLHSRQQMQGFYDTFRRQFGPEVLRSLDGLPLLERMHAHGNRDSLVYWLEFKADDEFPAIFGSIAGGSALKFGVYRRRETGTWAVKGTGAAPVDVSVDHAIEVARAHRDQLLAAADLLSGIKPDASDTDYHALQRGLERDAADVQNTAWGHKYLSLLFPNVLDDFHVESWQRWNLVRVLQTPPRDPESGDFAKGRYVCAGRFIALARELGVSVHDCGILVNRRHGSPGAYWRVGTTDDQRVRRKYWPMMRDGGVAAIGWPALGDLSEHAHGMEGREAVAELLRRHYPGTPQSVGQAASQLMKFVAQMKQGDRVLAADGMAVLGVGEITGGYQFTSGDDFPHQRPVAWRSVEEWRTVDAEALRTTVGAIRDYRNHVAAERHIIEDAAETARVLVAAPRPQPARVSETHDSSVIRRHDPLPRLTGVEGAVQSVLDRKGQVVLYGPPGTGKTHWGMNAARNLAALRAFGRPFAQLDVREREQVAGSASAPALVRTCTFHPEYGYEDFIEGFRPRTDSGGQLGFTLQPGIFRRICTDAERAPSLDFYLVVDEINRGDVPRIFGELLTLLERDKRGQAVLLPVSGEPFTVPTNVFVIGTMNTADRSIALLDVALRRRFGFVELMPDYATLGTTVIGGLPLGAWLADLNQRVRSVGGGDARNRQVGHSFLLDRGEAITGVDQLVAVLRDDIVPLLEEYCYDDFAQLADLLGPTLVDTQGQRVRRELFDVGRATELVAALMRPEISTAAAAVRAAPSELVDNTDGDVDGEDEDGDVPPTVSGSPARP